MPVNTGQLWYNEILPDHTQEYVTPAAQFVGVTGAMFYLLIDGGDAIVTVEIRPFKDGRWVPIARDTARDGILKVLKIDFYFPEARVRMAPKVDKSKAQVATYGYPAVYNRP